jgi:spore coat protein CotH
MSKFRTHLGAIGFLGLACTVVGAPGCSASENVPASDEAAATSAASGAELWNQSQTVFNDQVHALSLDMKQGDWNQMHEDENCAGTGNVGRKDSARWWHVDRLTVDGETFQHVAVKIKGNTSRCIPRVQLSVRLDKNSGVFSQGKEIAYDDAAKAILKSQSLKGMTEFALRRSANDSGVNGMLAREPVGAWAFGEAEKLKATTVRGAPVYRTAYSTVQFSFDGQNRFTRGYQIAEAINENFFKMRYDDTSATAISLTMGCGLQLDGGKSRLAWKLPDGRACHDPEFVEGAKFKGDDAALRAMFEGAGGLVTRLGQAKSIADVQQVIDLDSFLNYATAATLIGHWDSALGNNNNDALYQDANGKWRIIAWDLDNTMDFDNAPGRPDRPYTYRTDGRRAIFDTILSIPEVDKLFKERIASFLTKLYKDRDSGPLRDRLMNNVKRQVEAMNQKLAPDERFDTARTQEMTDYMTQRYVSLKTQLNIP